MHDRKSIKNIKSLRGMNDIVDDKAELFIYCIDSCCKIVKNYGFSYIETPILEETALFKRSVGQSSDIVNKEMYQFIDKGNNDVCLRPEGTAGVVRSFIEKKLDRVGVVQRYFYHGPMFRYERPQKGRLREFHQFGCEVFGADSVYEDANIIMMIKDILDFLGITFILELNSLGCEDCMGRYKEELVQYLTHVINNLCEDCNRRVNINPIRTLDCKNEKCQSLLIDAPKITDNLCKDCDTHFNKLQNILKFNTIAYRINKNLVRGLDYYTKTAFEFISEEIGAQSTIAAGGRYDKLVEILGGRCSSGIGFALGIQRLLGLVQIKNRNHDLIYFGAIGEEYIDLIFKKANKKRKESRVYVEYVSRNFNKHFKLAQKQNATTIALIGEEESKNGTIWVKNIITNEEMVLSYEDF